ncbi:hypothetical protein PR048_013393 [Dryococelus australis]|uniref:Uncharacterized protein n=1 Tax=Dryococelus australis TaxID=614101 RepID=A0ABQ9HS13_9NEOP|nr:hypothetical protein PR048_013393 [Dryococelus australis]
MICREPRNHCNDYYFCNFDVTCYNSKNKKVIRYPNLPSAIRPVGHGQDLPVPKPPEVFDDVIRDISIVAQSDADEQADDEFESTDNLEPKLFTQTELNDLFRDLGLTKEKAELFGSRLKEKNVLAVGTNIYVYRRRDETFF